MDNSQFEKLKNIKELYKEGILSEEEFINEKNKLLNQKDTSNKKIVKKQILNATKEKLMTLKNETKIYTNYGNVPFFRKQYVFWILLLGPILTRFALLFSMTKEEIYSMQMRIGCENFKPMAIHALSWISFLSILTAIGILIFGNIFYKKNDKVRSFDNKDRVIAFVLAVILLLMGR
ncbi:SHOCT domain-containing protein [Lentisphaerota bacterium WC36G]|nr:SHOCT domain-containing protein [Lentisphaerae bacterium WC36]